ncbi:MAG TPA: hypothetical protein VHT93_03505 [Pseudolabrys sp.]|jgi:FkbH-like protein|nr:hypothetical protein [Pseudolabrys sp.]
MAEAIRLVVRELDGTFWDGTILEGGIQYHQRTHDIVVALARRGIMNSICSKNDHATIEYILCKSGLWDYFVFPDINWYAKGPRLAKLIEDIQLRPATVLFIDDNPSNLSEAKYFVPDIQIADETIIASLLENPLLKGRDDHALTRLAHYKAMERRRADRAQAATNITDFLRASNIRVAIEYDVETHVDRAIELINRTNQLNFTKEPLSEDAAEARAELRALLAKFDPIAGLVRVVDDYGDHGFCGVFVLRITAAGNELIHYCLSCRVLGMGVEHYVYNLIGRPMLRIKGEVLSDPADPSIVDWISISEADENNPADDRATPRAIRGVYLRGGCDMMNIGHYFGASALEVVGEHNIQRNSVHLRLDHSLIGRYCIEGAPVAAMEPFVALGYYQDDFKSELFSRRPQGIWAFSFGADHWTPLFRHNRTGALIPFCRMMPGVADPTTVAAAERAIRIANARVREAIDVLERDFSYVGLTSEALFKANLRVMFDRVPRDAQAFVLLNRDFFGPDDTPAAHVINFNLWICDIASEYANIEPIEPAKFAQSREDFLLDGHFSRPAYFRLFNYIKERSAERLAAIAG